MMIDLNLRLSNYQTIFLLDDVAHTEASELWKKPSSQDKALTQNSQLQWI